MSDVIRLLPDSVANQIAAGEVIQRPSSVVKELVENAIDAGSTEIIINIKDAGKTLIQVSDNGFGMSETDARMAFERHATSKIKSANDLFSINTLGFRGEALASIAAIAQVELKTKKSDHELGTQIVISGSRVESQQAVQCSNGSSFFVKNLFYNVPARRKFLKSSSTEFNHIVEEFKRIACANISVSFTLIHNNTTIYQLSPSNLRQRIVGLFGKNINQSLVPIKVETSIVNINGFIGKAEFAKKNSGEQYFFVNHRFMKHSYFHKSVLTAYQNLIQPQTIPSYFIYFEIDPSKIDVNIHPTKTEIKFDEEFNIWKIMMVGIKESLGKFFTSNTLDFDIENPIDFPAIQKETFVQNPEIEVNHHYNPFQASGKYESKIHYRSNFEKENLQNWEKLYQGFEKEQQKELEKINKEADSNPEIFSTQTSEIQSKVSQFIFQFKNKFIVTNVKSGLMVIDQHLAHERILFEKYLNSLNNNKGISQMLLFPEMVYLSSSDSIIFNEISEQMLTLGFNFEKISESTFNITGIPADVTQIDIKELIEQFIDNFKNSYFDTSFEDYEKLALSLARISSVKYGKNLAKEEMNELIDNLFASQMPNYSPTGKPIITIISTEEIEERFKT